MTAAGRSRPPTKKPRPTASARPATAYQSRPAHRPVRLPDADDHDLLVRPCGDPQPTSRASPPGSVVPPQDDASYTDMLAALRRELIRHEFHAQGHSITTHQQIREPQLPSALAVA